LRIFKVKVVAQPNKNCYYLLQEAINMTIGEKIQYIRKDNKLSQEQLAEKLGVSRQAISKWELGDSIPDIEKIALLSKIYNVTTDSIILDTVDLDDHIQEIDVPVEENKLKKSAMVAGKTAKRYIYIVGYILIVFGIINLVFSAILGIVWIEFSKELSSFLLQYSISLKLQFLFWIFILLAIFAVITLVIGIIIAKKGKKNNAREMI